MIKEWKECVLFYPIFRKALPFFTIRILQTVASGNGYGQVLRHAAQSLRIKRTSEFGKGAKPNFILNFMHFKSLKKQLTNLKINAISLKKIPALKLKLANFESEKTRILFKGKFSDLNPLISLLRSRSLSRHTTLLPTWGRSVA